MKHLSRRTMLRGILGGAAVAIALPPLEAMLHHNGTALADGTPFPKRFLSWFFGNGVRLDRWVPTATGVGDAWALTPALAPLVNVKQYLNLLTGFDVGAAAAHRRGHHDGIAGLFSGIPFILLDPKGAPYASKLAGPTLDQIMVQSGQVGGILPFTAVGVCKRNNTTQGPTLEYLSHRGPDDPVPSETSPQNVFASLFGSFVPVTDKSGKVRASVLDAVKTDVLSLQKKLGKADQARLDAHLSGINDLQAKIVALPPTCAMPGAPTVQNVDVDGKQPLQDISHVMADLVTYAFACDVTRIITFNQAGASSDTIYDAVGATQTQHDLTHSSSDADQDMVHQGVVFDMGCFAYLLEKLVATPEGDGNILDHAAVLLSSDVAEGQTHASLDIPLLVAGRQGGAFASGGMHYRSATAENASDLMLRLIQTMVPSITSFGGDTGLTTTPFTGLDA